MLDCFDYIHKYSREDALHDGVLIDITETAKELGFKFPVAVTKTVWDGYIKDSGGGLWDTLWMLYVAIKNSSQTDTIFYKLYYGRKLVELKAVIGPGDAGEPVITIMLPEED